MKRVRTYGIYIGRELLLKKYEKINDKTILKLLCIIFTITAFGALIYDYQSKNISISTIILAVFDVTAVLLVVMPSKQLRHLIIIHQQYDAHFVDRENECEKTLSFLKEKDNNLLIVSGCQGLGKTQLLKTVSDHINFSLQWNLFYNAVYVKVSDNGIMHDMSEALAFDSVSTIEDICIRTKQLGKYKRWVFLLDNIMPENQIEVKEFAHAVAYHCPKYKFVLGITRLSNNNELQLGRFGTEEIHLLENSYNIELTDEERMNIASCSYGLPVYIRFLIENRNHEPVSASYVISDMGIYIKSLIEDNLSNDAVILLSFIVFYVGISNESLTIKQIKIMSSAANDYSFDELYRFSLVNIQSGKVKIEAKIAEICRDILSSIASDTYFSIYECCCNDPYRKHIALRALLRTKKLIQDNIFTKAIMRQQHNQKNYAYFVRIGRDYIQNQIHQLFCSDEETRLLFWFYYFDSLLTLGMYPDARIALDLINKNIANFGGILNKYSQLRFQTEFYIIDLEHLTNHFFDAANYAYALEKQCVNNTQKNMCKYLYAHCLKHMGEDLMTSEKIFSSLAYDEENKNISQKIRAFYSLISIHIFWNDNKFDFDDAFSKINDLIKNEKESYNIIPNVNRHLSYYQQIIQDADSVAKNTLDIATEMLEKKPQRIIYDFYFEIGEWHRLAFNKTHNKNDYLNSIANLKKAINFAKEVGDYNLESMATLSKILLLKEQKNISINLNNLINEVNTIISKTKQYKMYINNSFAEYVLYILKTEKIPYSYINYWFKMRYMLIVKAAKNYNKTSVCDIRLMVM